MSVTQEHQKAVKADSEKPRMHLVPPKALLEIAKVLTFGAKKYADYNYRLGDGLDWTRVSNALDRHHKAWLSGADNDPETGISHLAHVGACVMMLLDLQQRGIGKDDRPK